MAVVLFISVYGVNTCITADYASPPERIVSLVPNMADILFVLGLGGNLVGVTTFCDYPEEAKIKNENRLNDQPITRSGAIAQAGCRRDDNGRVPEGIRGTAQVNKV